MFKTFDIKTYPQLNFALGSVNTLLVIGTLTLSYFLVLTPQDVARIDKLLEFVTQGKIFDLVSLLVVAMLWGWICTHFFRLHDRIHEPYIRMWRSQYDADFVLRSLLSDVRGSIPEEFFSRAYHDKRIRRRLMQRLFYNFIGDETTTAKGRRLFFYTEMWKYWTLALADLYAFASLIAFSVYHWATSTTMAPGLVLFLVLTLVVARMVSNSVLNNAHEITEEQIAAVKKTHAGELQDEVIAISTDIGL